MKSTYSVIGAMAGSSMDGLDLAHITFHKKHDDWAFEMGRTITIPYDSDLFARLESAPSVPRNKQEKLDADFGRWIGDQVNRFKSDLPEIDLLGIHGHTLIHQPENGISWQLGKGELIAECCKLPTVTRFRTLDVSLGGQGAPLVPLGDFLLFKEYEACLNLGGIANISIQKSQNAWDICPCNQVLNYFSTKLGHAFDAGGEMARSGKMNGSFYTQISQLPYFVQKPPKSLPNNFIDHRLLDTVDSIDGLHTYSHLIADKIAESLIGNRPSKLLITGGGALNKFLVECISRKCDSWQTLIPDKDLISFKESLIFAFLALKKFKNETNVLASVTGASKDSSSGVIHLP